MKLSLAIILILAAAILAAAAAALLMRRRDRKKISYMLDALEDGELNFHFVEKDSFNRTLDRQRQRSEQESWTKLIRVLTHEIMNTVSPIASLSEALSEQAELPPSEQDMDVKAGLKTISTSSRDLIKFVESYRELSGAARPVRKAVMLDELVERLMHLTERQCSEAGASITYKASSDDILIFVDEGQISQIFINIVKNALQAGAGAIDISAFCVPVAHIEGEAAIESEASHLLSL